MQLFLLRSRFFISIHALRVEGDLPEAPRRSKTSHFYPRPPGGGRRTDRPQAPGKAEFLSTPSGWRATSRRKRVEQSIKKFLSTPSGWRATLVVYDRVKTESDFYPRPPGGGRPFAIVKTSYYLNFYPRPPGGGRHDVGVQGRVGDNISIHALRVEGDYHLFSDCPFLIRFLSTPSGWRATIVEKSIRSTFFDFYPRPPGGGRQDVRALADIIMDISIHALRVEGDRCHFCADCLRTDFYPRPPGGGRPQARAR